MVADYLTINIRVYTIRPTISISAALSTAAEYVRLSMCVAEDVRLSMCVFVFAPTDKRQAGEAHRPCVQGHEPPCGREDVVCAHPTRVGLAPPP